MKVGNFRFWAAPICRGVVVAVVVEPLAVPESHFELPVVHRRELLDLAGDAHVDPRHRLLDVARPPDTAPAAATLPVFKHVLDRQLWGSPRQSRTSSGRRRRVLDV
jgi:hypothetical protein